MGTFSLIKVDELKKTSAARHVARMSATSIEAGRTNPELSLPARAETHSRRIVVPAPAVEPAGAEE